MYIQEHEICHVYNILGRGYNMAVLLRVLKKTGVFCAVMGVGWCLMTVTTPSREDVMKVWTKIRVDSCICIMLYIIIISLHIYMVRAGNFGRKLQATISDSPIS